MISDNPNRVSAPGEHWMDSLTDRDYLDSVQDRAFETAHDAGMFDPEHTLIDCCTAAIDMQPNTIRTGGEIMAETFRRFESIFGRRA